MNYFIILGCAIVGVIFSTVWYSIFGEQMAKLHKAYAGSQRPAPWQVVIELARNIVLASVLVCSAILGTWR